MTDSDICFWVFVGFWVKLCCARMSHFAMASEFHHSATRKIYSSQLYTFALYFFVHSFLMNDFAYLQEFPSHVVGMESKHHKNIPCPSGEKTSAILKSSYFQKINLVRINFQPKSCEISAQNPNMFQFNKTLNQAVDQLPGKDLKSDAEGRTACMILAICCEVYVLFISVLTPNRLPNCDVPMQMPEKTLSSCFSWCNVLPWMLL